MDNQNTPDNPAPDNQLTPEQRTQIEQDFLAFCNSHQIDVFAVPFILPDGRIAAGIEYKKTIRTEGEVVEQPAVPPIPTDPAPVPETDPAPAPESTQPVVEGETVPNEPQP